MSLSPETRNEQLENLAEIRSLMERSTRFLSLSGLSGVSIGIIALIGTVFAWIYLDYEIDWTHSRTELEGELFGNPQAIPMKFVWQLGGAAIATLLAALGAAAFFTTRKARKLGMPVWSKAANLMVINLAIPLVAGGIFCFILFYWHLFGLIAPATLIFYGLALINASKYTLGEIRLLGIAEIALGLVACVWLRQSLLFWGIGFGVLHVLYGLLMYYRYER